MHHILGHSHAQMPLAFAALFALIEFSLAADWLTRASIINTGPVGWTLFVSIWSLITIAGHFTFPFLIGAAWTLLTTIFWLASAAALTAKMCVSLSDFFNDDYDDIPYFYPTRASRYCLSSEGRYAGLVALAWLNIFTFLAAFLLIVWHVVKARKAAWRSGMYGKNYFWKSHYSPTTPEKHVMGQVSPSTSTTGFVRQVGDSTSSFAPIRNVA